MSIRNEGRSGGRNVWMFMAATAMATTVSTLAATAMVKADTAQALEVTCDCEAVEPKCDSVPAAAAATPAIPATPAKAPPAPVEVTDQDATTHVGVRPASVSVNGSLDKDIIRRIVRAHIDEVRYCYNEGLAKDPQLAGRVVVQFTIGHDGEVVTSQVVSTSLEDGEVAPCIASAVAGWPFPKSTDGQNAVVSYPFVLEPG